MNRILYSIVTIVVAVSAVVAGTGAFFSDTERARGNTFAAGVIDLKVDNESYYNGNRCMDVDDSEESEDWRWVGTAPYPEPGAVCTTSWLLDDLANGYLFFNFTDLKPDDEGEDTISLHVGTNAAWACMDVSLTSDDDRSSTEPELHVDVADVPGDTWDGELADNLEFVWWADDGDNVLETGEAILSTGVGHHLPQARRTTLERRGASVRSRRQPFRMTVICIHKSVARQGGAAMVLHLAMKRRPMG
jgi:predicted ribosomally synthesized peptide with SipW-like signal peptide